MRFLFGLFSGAVVTLLVATAMDAPTHPVLNGAKDAAAGAWTQLISSTSDSLFEHPEQTAPVVPGKPVNENLFAAAEPDTDIPVSEEALAEPIPALPPPDPIDELPVSGFWVETAPSLEAGDSNPVWTPFHSQMSAEGFAARLSQALDRDFRVERQGAGAYQVVFDTADPSERDLILAQISEITGL